MTRIKSLAKRHLKFIIFRVASMVRSDPHEREEQVVLNQGRQLSVWTHNLDQIKQLEEAEFRVFSQFGDDGIIQYIVRHLNNLPETFIEFGVESYKESNTRFLLMNNNWSGFVMDGSREHIDDIVSSYYYWRYELQAKSAFINAENINDLLSYRRFLDVGLLNIDIDGNDYWIWKAIHCITPAIVVVEYNSVFGADRAISIPYDPTFTRTNAHYSNLYYGASLAALNSLASDKGYKLIGSNSAGNNAYFVRSDLVNEYLKPLSVEQAYRRSKFRESRDAAGAMTFRIDEERLQTIKGLPVTNVLTDTVEPL